MGAEEKNIETPQELLDLLERGEEYKRYGATGTNSLDVFKFSISIYSMYCYGATSTKSLQVLNNTLTFC